MLLLIGHCAITGRSLCCDQYVTVLLPVGQCVLPVGHCVVTSSLLVTSRSLCHYQ